MAETTNGKTMGGAGFSPLRPFLYSFLLLMLASAEAGAATTDPVVKPTRVEGTLTIRTAVRDDQGKVIGSRPSVPERVVLYIGGSALTLTQGKYGVDLATGSYPFLAETTINIKPKRSSQIIERYWAMGAVRIEPNSPAVMANDLDLVLVEDSQAFCRTCHPDFRMTLSQVQSCHHSTGKPLKEIYKKPFARSGLALEGNLMVCITCHAPHQPTKHKKFLRRTMDRNELCIQCHV